MRHTLTLLTALLLAPLAELHSAESTFQSQHLAISLSPRALAFAVDSLGQGRTRPCLDPRLIRSQVALVSSMGKRN